MVVQRKIKKLFAKYPEINYQEEKAINEGVALMKNYHVLDLIAAILLLIGGVNWGLFGLFKLNLIDSIFGEALGRIIFVLVGVAAVYRIIMWIRTKKSV